MRYTMVQDPDGNWDLYDTVREVSVIRGESYTFVSQVQAELNSPGSADPASEVYEVAEWIGRDNPHV